MGSAEAWAMRGSLTAHAVNTSVMSMIATKPPSHSLPKPAPRPLPPHTPYELVPRPPWLGGLSAREVGLLGCREPKPQSRVPRAPPRSADMGPWDPHPPPRMAGGGAGWVWGL
ncbi:hypothetical protein [Vulcanisaeta souniana]|uniref:hypothetical protein n=1 Tax=Vulcanisaeta souniana TaxID=164452 RepID=UPI001667112E|nr:hypothetical protein [Vulcanisaeta souniana]